MGATAITAIAVKCFVCTYMEMNPSANEIRLREKPALFKQEIDWFAEGFNHPKTMLEISASKIDAFLTMICGKPGDQMLSTYGKCIFWVIFTMYVYGIRKGKELYSSV